ncbi:MAG: radical SAM protein [Dehalococcoidia bacterium]
MRTSSYTIYVDLPDTSEEVLLVHGYSGAYDKVSHGVANYVRSLETGRPPRPLYGEWSPEPVIEGETALPATETIERLRKRGYLTEQTREEEVESFSRIANKLHALSNRPSYIFMPTYDCNLRCSYCFQDHMRTDPRFKRLLRTMEPELVDRLFAAMPQIEEHHGLEPGPQSRSSMGLFGGEPLLEQSRSIVEYIIRRAQAEGETTFWAITNGTQLDAYYDLLNPRQLAQLQITIDGPPAEHDRRRIHADGSGSFEQIARNMAVVLDQGVRVQVRMNIDRTNVEELPALADEIVRRGWDRYENFMAYTAPIQAANDKTDSKTTFGSWELDKAVNRLREQHATMRVINRPDDPMMYRAQTLFSTQQLPSLTASYCGAHNGMYLFDAFGDLYACWERTGDPNIRIGRVTEDGDFELKAPMATMWRSRNVTTNPTCRQCRFALYCGGGCAVLAEGHRGEFFTNFCDGFSARFRASVAEAYVRHIAGEGVGAVLGAGCDT